MEQRDRLYRVVGEACDHGYGEINIKILDDGEFFIIDSRWKKNPSILDIQQATEGAEHLQFGGIEVTDGQVMILKRYKKIKII